MLAYLGYDDGRIEEIGEVSVDEVPALLEKAVRSLNGQDQFGIGLYRSESDFVQITPVGSSQFLVWSDRLLRRRGLLGFILPRRAIQQIVHGTSAAVEVAESYFSLPRDKFEARYD